MNEHDQALQDIITLKTIVENNDKEIQQINARFLKISRVFGEILTPPSSLLSSSSDDEKSPIYENNQTKQQEDFDRWLDTVLNMISTKFFIF